MEFVAPEISDPLFCHWYVGEVPPFVGVAVKVTLSPVHIVFEGLASIATLGVAPETVTTTGVRALEHPGSCTCQL